MSAAPSAAGLSWPLPEGMDDAALEKTLAADGAAPADRRGLPDLAYLLEEMRKPHVTLTLLWMEYKAAHPEGYQYTQFWRYYQEGKKRLEVSLRQEHRAGEKLFSDYSGDTLRLPRPSLVMPPTSLVHRGQRRRSLEDFSCVRRGATLLLRRRRRRREAGGKGRWRGGEAERWG